MVYFIACLQATKISEVEAYFVGVTHNENLRVRTFKVDEITLPYNMIYYYDSDAGSLLSTLKEIDYTTNQSI